MFTPDDARKLDAEAVRRWQRGTIPTLATITAQADACGALKAFQEDTCRLIRVHGLCRTLSTHDTSFLRACRITW